MNESAVAPLHVVEIIDSLGTGGAEMLLALRARHPDRPARRLDVISLGIKDSLLESLRPHVASLHAFPSPHVLDTRRIRDLCRLLRTLAPDVVHTHLRMSNTVGVCCARLSGIPSVATLHSIFPEPGRAHARRDWAERMTLRRCASVVTAVGPAVAESHRARLRDRRIEVLANPVALPDDSLDPQTRKRQARHQLELPITTGDRPVVLTVARLTGIKGFPVSLEIVHELVRQRPDVCYLIAGDGELREPLQRYIDRHGLNDNVALLGRTERVRELMAASDVLLLASSGEGLPLVVLEAMSMHLPVVATAVGDVPGLLENGRAGKPVVVGDVSGCARVLRELLDSPDERQRIAERAFQRVRSDFSPQDWLDQTRAIYRQAIERHGNQGVGWLAPTLFNMDRPA